MPIKRKRPEKETKLSSKKQNKLAKMTSEEVSGDDGGNDSEDGQSHSSEEKPVKVTLLISIVNNGCLQLLLLNKILTNCRKK